MYKRFSSFLVVAILLAWSASSQAYVGDLDGMFEVECGPNPTQQCAVGFWTTAMNYYWGLYQQMNGMINHPNFVFWCTNNPSECQQAMEERDAYQQAYYYSHGMLNVWS